ncbi:MAG: hypothetical protein ACOC32_05255 [Nanoarchaeota archaeon]
MRKAQSLSMNTIVIAALALLVLAIISLLFIGRMNTASGDINSCRSNGGVCLDSTQFGGDCSNALDPTYDWREAYKYSAGRELRSYKCYDATGDVQPNQMCCAFT